MITTKKMFWSLLNSQLISKEMYEYRYGELICGYSGGLRLYLGIETVSNINFLPTIYISFQEK